MPFEPGHKPYPPKDYSHNARGIHRLRKNLALYLNEVLSEEEIYTWLRTVAAGKDPDAKPGELSTPPDWSTRKAAMGMLLDRRLGRPAEHVMIQQELRAAIGVASISATPEALAAMQPAEKAQLRALLQKVAKPVLEAQVASARDAAVQSAIERARAEEGDE